LVLSGTGSCCFGRDARGRTAKAGGWGHILGDGGSGFEMAMSALRAVIAEFDRTGKLPKLGQNFLRALQLNEPNQFIAWAQAAGKDAVAALAVEVFAANACGDRLARAVLSLSANCLVAEANACARQLARHGERVDFIFAGSNLLKQPQFAKLVSARLKKLWPRAVVTPLARESACGAVELGNKQSLKSKVQSPKSAIQSVAELALPMLSPTELRHPRSRKLDKLTTQQGIELMLSEDETIPAALRAERKQIARAVNWIAEAFNRGGKLFYIGAGTSGRLGILDASECPPTFRTPPELVQGIIAGGQRAIWQAVEGAEDDATGGASAMAFRGVTRRDVVVGIAASGRTPFVLGALTEARRRGAKTVLLCFNPHVHGEKISRGHLVIAPEIGPEILTGSTRLKAGTATKLVLNIFTTLAMVRLGKVVSNLMVDVKPSNVKLRARAVRIVRELTGADAAMAQRALEKSGWVVKAALRRLEVASRRTAGRLTP
jgi:N-acetylmuramic acid 6-phosphate etherase